MEARLLGQGKGKMEVEANFEEERIERREGGKKKVR